MRDQRFFRLNSISMNLRIKSCTNLLFPIATLIVTMFTYIHILKLALNNHMNFSFQFVDMNFSFQFVVRASFLHELLSYLIDHITIVISMQTETSNKACTSQYMRIYLMKIYLLLSGEYFACDDVIKFYYIL